MSTASERTIQALEQVVKDVPVGTDLAPVSYTHLMSDLCQFDKALCTDISNFANCSELILDIV